MKERRGQEWVLNVDLNHRNNQKRDSVGTRFKAVMLCIGNKEAGEG